MTVYGRCGHKKHKRLKLCLWCFIVALITLADARGKLTGILGAPAWALVR